jgi:hypothetical protein
MRHTPSLPRAFVLVAFICLIHDAAAQDTLSVFFEFGKWRIPREEQKILSSMPYRYELSALDSVQFIGMADSIGSLASNLKLSHKRAVEVAEHFRKHHPALTPISTFAMGAIDQGNRARNRRVDIVFHLKQSTEQEHVAHDGSGDPKPKPELPCYIRDCDLMSRSIVTHFMKGRREFVEIEIPGRLTEANPSGSILNMNVPRFRIVSSSNDAVRLKWTRKPSRNKKAPSAYITSLPKADFDRRGVLVEKKGDCVEPTLDTCVRIDHALMQELQYRPGFKSSKSLMVRAPRSIVDPTARYFYGCRPGSPFEWEERSGKKHSAYYYTRLPTWQGFARGISREMVSCIGSCDTTYCNRGIIRCQYRAPADLALKLIIEGGFHGQKNDNRPYLHVGFMKAGIQGFASAQVGIDSDLRPLASLRYQFHFLQFSAQQLIPTEQWLWPSDQAIIYRYFRTYVGTEFRWRAGSAEQGLLEQNLHLGIAYLNEKPDALLTRIFIQGGGAIDFSSTTPDRLYLCWSIGTFFRLYRFGA